MATLEGFLANAKQGRGLTQRQRRQHAAAASRHRLLPEKDIYIYFGSQTGTARSFAQLLDAEATHRGLSSRVVDLLHFDPLNFRRHKCIIICAATYGDGAPTPSAQHFFEWLEDVRVPRTFLDGVHFAAFGLGSRDYVDFNGFGRCVDASMEWKGAQRIYDRGEGDSAGDIGMDFQRWREGGLWAAIETVVGVRKAKPARSLRSSVESVARLEAAEEGARPQTRKQFQSWTYPGDTCLPCGLRQATRLPREETISATTSMAHLHQTSVKKVMTVQQTS
jgi:sulfite reductase alpha subunit-like flavoprotein